jgi:catechol 2,3-dioxygenase-like lactoylglutathione lyase family enzyme
MIDAVFHFNLNVRDLDRSIAFYVGLGFNLIDRMEVEAEGLGAPLGIEARALRTAFLSLDDGTGRPWPMLDLVQFVIPEPKGQPYARLNNAGIGRIAFWANDVAVVAGLAIELGASNIGPEHQMIGPGGQPMRTICLADPDGIVIQVFGPTSARC